MRIAALVWTLAALSATSAHTDARPAKFQLYGITWVFKEHGTMVRESVDRHGNYVARTFDGKELDHGRAVMKGNKACFTSAVDSTGEVCWTTRTLSIGSSMVSTSDKGETLKVRRVPYVPMKAGK